MTNFSCIRKFIDFGGAWCAKLEHQSARLRNVREKLNFFIILTHLLWFVNMLEFKEVKLNLIWNIFQHHRLFLLRLQSMNCSSLLLTGHASPNELCPLSISYSISLQFSTTLTKLTFLDVYEQKNNKSFSINHSFSRSWYWIDHFIASNMSYLFKYNRIRMRLNRL